MTNEKFKQVMSLLAEQYGRKVSQLTAKAYWQVLKEFTDEQVEKAVIDYIGDPDVCQYWPQPGAIKSKITGNSKDSDIAITDKALSAWDLITKEIRRIGAYGSLNLHDKLALKAVQVIGGWRSLCHTPVEKMEWRRKEFLEAYKTFKGSEQLPEKLAGIGQQESKIESVMDKINEKIESR